MNTTSSSLPWLSRAALLLVACALLLLGLGDRALIGSEDRWAEVARNMLQHRDWFHPVINGEIYFDKPLASYWLIVIASFITQTLDEFTVRLPCAAAGALSLYATFVLASRWFDQAGHKTVAWLSVWLMATSYGFLFWTHTAAAEMTNLALIICAIAWFEVRQQQRNFISYAVFYVLCAIGSQMKGLTAVVVPLLVLTPWLLREKRWLQHLNLAHFAALAVSGVLFALPYLGASHEALPEGVKAQGNHLSGIDLLIRENIVRFFHPFDHVDPWYSYLYQVPRIVFPWCFFLVAALAFYLPRYRLSTRAVTTVPNKPVLSKQQRWLLEAMAMIFLFFTASGSRRWYYILPILPFCTILIAAYLTEARFQRSMRIASLLTSLVLAVVALALVLAPLLVNALTTSAPVPYEFWFAGLLVIIAGGALFLLNTKKLASLLNLLQLDSTTLPANTGLRLLLTIVLMTALFGFALPGTDYYRQEKTFALTLADQLKPDDQVVFFKRKQTTTVYYLDSPQAFPVINHAAEIPVDAKSVILITEAQDKDALFKEFPALATAQPLLAAKQFPEKWVYDKSALAAYKLNK